MKPTHRLLCLLLLPFAACAAAPSPPAVAAPGDASRDRVYAAEQYSNTVSVTDPSSNRLLGLIRLGEPQPANLSPLYKGQLLVHGLGFSPDGRTLAAVSIGSNSVSFIDTASNEVRHVTYLGRSPHEAFFTPDGKEVWVTVRGEDYIAVLDTRSYQEVGRIKVAAGPGMQIFSPDGRYGYVCSSFNRETVVIEVKTREIVGRVKQESAFCPNIAATSDGKQVWLTLKDVGKVMVFDARPPFAVTRVLDTGPLTNHVNFARHGDDQFAYVTVGGLNQVKVFRTDTFEPVATVPVGKLPHGLWPSADGRRMYVGLENEDKLAVIDTTTHRVVATVPVGQAPQAVVYVRNAVREGEGTRNLRPLDAAVGATHLELVPANADAKPGAGAPTVVALFDQGLSQILQAAVTGLTPGESYVLALAERADGTGPLQPLAAFKANPAGASVVNAVAPVRQLIGDGPENARRYLVIASGTPERPGRPVQRQKR